MVRAAVYLDEGRPTGCGLTGTCCLWDSWRVVKNVVVLREWSLHASLGQNGIRLEFPSAFCCILLSMWRLC